MSKTSNLIMGIDPGYDRVGICILENEKGKDTLLYSNCIITDKKLADYERVKIVCDEIEKVIQKYNIEDSKISCVGIETLFVFKNQKTVMGVSEARGAIKYILNKNNIKIIELTPMQVKSSVCGSGHSHKDQVDYMVRNILKIDASKKIIDDEIDAMAIALTASLFYKNKNIL